MQKFKYVVLQNAYVAIYEGRREQFISKGETLLLSKPLTPQKSWDHIVHPVSPAAVKGWHGVDAESLDIAGLSEEALQELLDEGAFPTAKVSEYLVDAYGVKDPGEDPVALIRELSLRRAGGVGKKQAPSRASDAKRKGKKNADVI